MLGKVVFWMHKEDPWTHQLRAALVSLVQDKRSQKIKPVNIPARMTEGHQVPSLAKELLPVKGCWGRGSNFSSGMYVATGKVAHDPVKNPTLMHMQATLIKLSGLENKN